jgi:hypothetical protein
LDRAAFARYGDLIIRLCEAYLPEVARMASPQAARRQDA